MSLRPSMPELDVKRRRHNFDEVALGYGAKQAIAEAKRCLQCRDAKAGCVQGCPTEINIPRFVKYVSEGDFDSAIEVIKERNALPAICGRVCPYENQCEKMCVLSKKGEALAIGRLERFVADHERKRGIKASKKAETSGKRVAVIGSGPAGLAAAADLAKLGHDVTIYEALHEVGGVLMYGIPEFRLPKDIVQAEVEYVKQLGVSIQTNVVIGKSLGVEKLLRQFDAVFIGTGAGLPRFLNIPGENLNGVYSSNEFLIRTNLMKAYKFPEYDTPLKVGKKVAVIGAGNVAIDSARVALRLGGEDVYIIYRRSEKEMPARLEEIERAREEGVRFKLLTDPVRIIGDEGGWVKQIECVKMELGDFDKSGRRTPIPIEGSEFTLDVDTVIVAIGQSPNPLISKMTKGLKTTEDGAIEVDENGMTSIDGVFAGGDITPGTATVIEAMSAGKRAARTIHEYISR
ncbi:MAG: NADPH-dependent glutamate synthase [Methanosarcinales archaeon Met12]|nr:MAG: NADPH-dependent glutamate synthase [Methanosarcinales archaeon Met12]